MVLEPTTRTVVRTTFCRLTTLYAAVALRAPSRLRIRATTASLPGSLRVITTRQLMKAKCRTNANHQAVGVTAELVEPGTGGRSLVAERGDVAAFHLFCGSAECS